MKFVVLLLFSPLVASSFTSLCPQQPNNVVVNCNNQNPNQFQNGNGNGNNNFPFNRGRGFNTGYNAIPRRSTLDFQRQRKDSSEESGSNSESDESSEELMNYQIPFYPTHSGSQQHIPSAHSTPNNKLDFMRHGGGAYRNDMRTYPKRNDIREYLSSTRDNYGTSSLDETHGHGHSGTYNHNTHIPVYVRQHGHNHEHSHLQYVTYPIHAAAGTYQIPEQVVPIRRGPSGASSDIYVNNHGNFNLDRGDPRFGSQILQISAAHPSQREQNQAEQYLETGRTTQEFESLISSLVPMISFPTVKQDGLNTEITCELIPIDSVDLDTTNAQGGQIQFNGAVSTVSDVLLLPGQQSSSTFTTSGIQDGNAQGLSQNQEESTVTKVTTTKVEERPIEESAGSTITKVTTTKVQKRPTTETHGTSTNIGSTITKVTTTTTDKLPVQTSSHSGSKFTTVTTTKNEGRPIIADINIPDIIVDEGPVRTSSSSGSTITTVTTTQTEGQPINTASETTTDERPMSTQLTEVFSDGDAETLVPVPEGGDIVGDASDSERLVRPPRDGTYRFDSYRQGMAPLVYGV